MDAFIFFAAIASVIIVISMNQHKERMQMIQKGKHPYASIPRVKYGSMTLLFGLVVIGVGLALLISSTLVMRHFDRHLMMASLIFLFGGGATMLYWKLTTQDREFARRIHQEHLTRLAKEYSHEENQENATENK